MRYATLALVLTTAGCLGGHYIPTDRYALDPPTQVAPALPTDHSLGIRPLDPNLPYKLPIVVRKSGYQVDFYTNTEWAELPRDVVTQTLCDALVASGRFKDVGDAADMRAPDFVLTGQLRKFHEDRTSEIRLAVCEVRLELRGGLERKAVWAATLDAREPLETNDVAALADAMGRAIARVVEQAVVAIATCDLGPSLEDREQEL